MEGKIINFLIFLVIIHCPSMRECLAIDDSTTGYYKSGKPGGYYKDKKINGQISNDEIHNLSNKDNTISQINNTDMHSSYNDKIGQISNQNSSDTNKNVEISNRYLYNSSKANQKVRRQTENQIKKSYTCSFRRTFFQIKINWALKEQQDKQLGKQVR